MAALTLLGWLLLVAAEAKYFLRADSEPWSGSEGCEFGHLPCDNGQCIPRKSWCDGPEDCSDTSDEMYCRVRTPFDAPDAPLNACNESLHFGCEAGDCVPKAARCDDLPDCGGGEDEENCDYYYFDSTLEADQASTTAAAPTAKGVLQSPLQADSLKKALRFVLEQRDSQWGWGQSTAKMAVALSLGNGSFFDPENPEGQLSKKQLQVQLAVDLMRKQDVPIQLPELSHYVHALLVVCNNPRDFHGVNVLKLLKKEMNRRRGKNLFVSPLAYLALCSAGDTSDSHIRRIKNMAYRRSQEQRWLDIQAYALLAIACHSRRNGSSVEWDVLKEDVARNLSEWQMADGSFGSVYSTGLALQALIAAEEPGTETAKGRAMTYLKLKQNWDGSFGSELDTFYVLPALNLNSMAHIGERTCKLMPPSTLSTEAAKERKRKKMQVHYSLWMGGEKNEMHTITLGLPPHSNFLEVMEAAERANPKYKHVLWMGNGGPVVDSIAGRSADVEKSLYWTLYRKVPLPFRPLLSNATATSARLRLLGATKYIKDIRKLHPKDGEHLAFWLRSYA